MPDELDARIERALREEVAALPFTVTAAMVERRLEQRPAPLRMAVVGGLAVLAVLVVTALIGSGLIGPQPNIGPPSSSTPLPTAAAPSTQQPAVTLPPRPQPAASISPNTGPILSWEEVPFGSWSFADTVAYTGDRFVTFWWGQDPGLAAGTSLDGLNWNAADGTVVLYPRAGTGWGASEQLAAWGGTILSWGSGDPADPANLHLWRTDGTEATYDFHVSDAAIGPHGIVVFGATTHYGPSEEGWITESGWFSSTGDRWLPFTDPPHYVPADQTSSPGSLVRACCPRVAATPDGFVAVMQDGTAWSSPDGLAWRVVGSDPSETVVDDLLSWRDGAVSVDYLTGRYVYWTSAGGAELPMSSGLPKGPGTSYPPATAAGPLGIVTVDLPANLVLFSADGRAWRATELPAQLNWDNGGWNEASLAVGSDAVIALLWEQRSGGEVPHLFRGTLK